MADDTRAVFRDAAGDVIPYGHRWEGHPDPATYSVTVHPERFAPLVAAARVLVAGLSDEYAVTAQADSLDVWPGTTVVEVTRLVPETAGAAPISVAITDFPGVRVRVGGHALFTYPFCGCDACDDDVDELITELHELVDAVTAGRFVEWGTAESPGYEYDGPWGSRGARSDVGSRDSATTWSPWVPRQPRGSE